MSTQQEAIQYIEGITGEKVQWLPGESMVSVRVAAYTCCKHMRHGSRWFVEPSRQEALREAVAYVARDRAACCHLSD